MPLEAFLNRKTRWVRIAMLALSPLAYLAGSFLIFKHDPNVEVGFRVDRRTAIEAAARFAISKGIDVTGWESLLKVKDVNATNDLLFYYHLDKGEEGRIARGLAPEVALGVRFKSPDRLETLEVEIGPDGRVLGYTRYFSKRREVGAIAETEARRLAVEAIKARLAQSGATAGVAPALEERIEDGAVIRKYTWKWPLTTIPELTVSSEVIFRGGVMAADVVTAKLDSAFAASRLNGGSTPKIVLTVTYVALIVVVVIFGLYRFVQRLKQKEISYSRIALMTAVFAAVTSLFVLLTDVALYDIAADFNDTLPDWLLTSIIYFTSVMSQILVGLFLGIAYGSGEGDIRESYPGKLVSLDALVTGRVFSRNVSRSFLIGCGLGGWMLWLSALASLPWQGRPGCGEGLSGALDPWFGRLPLMAPIILTPTDATLITVFGLLIPLPFLHRHFRSRRVIIGLSAVFVWIVCAAPGYLSFRPLAGLLSMAAARAFIFLLAFFYFDLGAAVVCVAAPTFLSFALQMFAQPSRSVHEGGLISMLFAAVSLLVAFIFAFKGRFYSEDEVRPVYAKRQAERISMQAEASAAREAQKRLMPERLPSLPNLSVAACCHPAHEVGGDFYDMFELEGGRLGVLIAEGGGKGLASALSIAFAKGFLTPRILGDCRSDDSPTELIRGLQNRLAAMLDDEARVGFAYAVIDPGEGVLRYARVGPHPAVMIADGTSPGALAFPEEREIKFESGKSPDACVSVIEGGCALKPGDGVAMLTDGIIKRWKNEKTGPAAELSKILTAAGDADPAAMQEALDKSLKERSKQARKRKTDDDLTVVIVKLTPRREIEDGE